MDAPDQLPHLRGWLRYPNAAKRDAACRLARERLILTEHQPEALTIIFDDDLRTEIVDVGMLEYTPLKHPLTLLAKGACAGWLDLHFPPSMPGSPRDHRFYAGGHPAYRYEHSGVVDHLLPATYRAKDGIGNAASPFRCVALAPDGTRCALAGGTLYATRNACVRRSFVLLVEPQTGTEVGRLYGHTGVVNSVAFSADGATLALGDSAMGLRIYEVTTGAVLASRKPGIHTYEPRTRSGGYSVASSVDVVRYLPDGHVITLGGTHVGVWDARKLTLQHHIAVAAANDGPELTSMAVHPNGRQAVCIAQPSFPNALVMHETGALFLVDLGQNMVSEPVPGLFVDAAYSPSGDSLAVIESLADPTALFDPFGHRLPVTSPQFAKRIRFLGASNLQPRWSVDVIGNPQRLLFAPDGDIFASVGVEQDLVVLRIWSTIDGSLIAVREHPWHGASGACTDLAMYGNWLVAVTKDAVRVFPAVF